MMNRIRLALAVIKGDAGSDHDHLVLDILDEMRVREALQTQARRRLEDAVRLTVLTAGRDNIARRPEGTSDAHTD